MHVEYLVFSERRKISALHSRRYGVFPEFGKREKKVRRVSSYRGLHKPQGALPELVFEAVLRCFQPPLPGEYACLKINGIEASRLLS